MLEMASSFVLGHPPSCDVPRRVRLVVGFPAALRGKDGRIGRSGWAGELGDYFEHLKATRR